MLIDWFTVIAQGLNFLILVWLLKRFLYKPILNAIDAREKRVADELANADAKEAKAQKEKEEFKRKNEEFDHQRAALLSRAKEEAKAERQRLLEEARKEVSDLSSKQQDDLRNEIHNLNQEISRRTEQEVFAITKKVLRDLAGMSLEERMVDVFAQKFHELKDEEERQLISVLKASQDNVLIRSAFDLSQEQRDLIKESIKETLGIEIKPSFETAPDLISGVELITNGQKVAWSIADYLSSLERSIDELLKEKSSPETETRSEYEPEGSSSQPGLQTQPEESEPEKLKPEESKPEKSKHEKPELEEPKPEESKPEESKPEKSAPQNIREDSKPETESEKDVRSNQNPQQRADKHGV